MDKQVLLLVESGPSILTHKKRKKSYCLLS